MILLPPQDMGLLHGQLFHSLCYYLSFSLVDIKIKTRGCHPRPEGCFLSLHYTRDQCTKLDKHSQGFISTTRYSLNIKQEGESAHLSLLETASFKAESVNRKERNCLPIPFVIGQLIVVLEPCDRGD